MSYKIIDLQWECYFSDGEIFETKQDIIDRLISYHSIDFEGVNESDEEIELEEYLSKYKIEEKLVWLLDWGQWDLEEVNTKK